MGTDTVFISYSHDSIDHSDRVLAFSNKLISMGIDAELDQYHTHPQEGWPQWCEVQLRPENSKFVLMICTRTYHDRIDNNVSANEGRGVYWEGGIINQYIYNNKGGGRFVPVLFGDEPSDSVPIRLQGFTEFRVKAFDLGDPGFEGLYRLLTGQPAVVKPARGARVLMQERAPSALQVAPPLPEKPTLSNLSPSVVEVRLDAGKRGAMIVGGFVLCAATAGLAIWVFHRQPARIPPSERPGPSASLPGPSPVAAPQAPLQEVPIWTPLPRVTKLINFNLKDAEVFSSPKQEHRLLITTIEPGTSLFLEGGTGPIQRATIDGEVWLRAQSKLLGSAFVAAKSLCQSGPGPCPYDEADPAVAK
jgi:SEFIR domain